MLSKTRIAVLVSGGGTNLEALLQAQESGKIPHGEIVVVLSSTAGAYALERAKNHGVPGFAVPRKELSQADFEAGLLEKLREVDGLRAEIARLERQRSRLQGRRVCPVCGAAVREGDIYCRECGGKL